jgi:hypothetical protein
MKHLIVILLLGLLSWGGVQAQLTEGGGAIGGDPTSPVSPTLPAGSYVNWPGWLQPWLEGGGVDELPAALVNAVLHEAKDWGQQTLGMSLGQMHQAFSNGVLTISYLPNNPPTNVIFFRVQCGGGLTIISIGDSL